MILSVLRRRNLILATSAAALFLLTAMTTVFSAQENLKPPAWVGIYTTAGKVGLKWTSAPGAVKYNLYRKVTSDKTRELIATTTDVSYIDAGVRPGETYYYLLKSVFANGKESGFSEERYIRVPVSAGGIPVRPPEWVGFLIEEKSVKLAWLPSPSSNALAYNVYKSKDKEKGFQLIGSTQDSSLTDTDVKEGETYYYVLTTLDKEFKETKFGEVRSVTFEVPKDTSRPEVGTGMAKIPEAALPEKVIAKPTRAIGYIIKGKDHVALSSPTDIDLGPDGNLYITDSGSSTIQCFKPGGEFVRAYGGFGREEGKFEKLLGVDVDASGHVYAVDAYTGRLQKFDREGHVVMFKNMREDGRLIALDLGIKKPVTEFGVVKPLVSPEGLIYLTDNYNDCIEVYNADGSYVKAFGGRGTADGKFQGPTFAVIDKSGNLMVTDCMNARVQVFDKDGKFLWKFGGYGNIVGTFGRPKGIALDEAGRIYIADSMSNVVQVFDKDGRFLFLLADERGKQMDLGTPNGIAVDKRRRIYMVEKLINRVQIRQVGD